MRKSKLYQSKIQHFNKTKSSGVNLGKRRKLEPNGQPGYIRVDTVHQGDKDKHKGVYHINAVDEVTQFEMIASAQAINENCLIPVLEAIIEAFPFVIINFYSDCGSEYINRYVVDLLQRLHVKLTKSRPCHSNDNAIVESKNGAIIRKCLGYVHIPQRWAEEINAFYRDHFAPYINFHQPCFFPEIIIDKRGREKKIYSYDNMITPYEKLKSPFHVE